MNGRRVPAYKAKCLLQAYILLQNNSITDVCSANVTNTNATAGISSRIDRMLQIAVRRSLLRNAPCSMFLYWNHCKFSNLDHSAWPHKFSTADVFLKLCHDHNLIQTDTRQSVSEYFGQLATSAIMCRCLPPARPCLQLRLLAVPRFEQRQAAWRLLPGP